MAIVFIPSQLRSLTQGVEQVRLDEALASLDETEKTTQEALAVKGIQVEPDPEPESAPNGD